MQTDYSVELGKDDPALELPWRSDDGVLRYFDLKDQPDLVLQIPEATDHPELSGFLTRMNAAGFPLQTAKCDVWFSREISAEEEIFGATGKFCSYVDIVFATDEARLTFDKHESLAKALCDLLQHAPEIPATVEFIVRRCYYHQTNGVVGQTAEDSVAASDASPASGFYVTTYTSGFGENQDEAHKYWTIALKLVQHALVQVANETTPVQDHS
jgi:hypothetical protein